MLKEGLKKGEWTLGTRVVKSRPDGKLVSYWRCECSCGNKGVVRADHLKNNRSRSCGCKKNNREARMRRNYGFE